MKTTNCNIYKEKCDIYCGRGKGNKNNPLNCLPGEEGWLGNPVIINTICPICQEKHVDGGSTLPCFELYLSQRIKDSAFCSELKKLKGKKLGCFCKPKPCHTDILIKIIDSL